MFANNYISAIVDQQLPDFIRADHPTFVTLFKKYYEYLEQSGKTLDTNKKLYDYFDVDTTRQDLITYFKSKIIPNFPEETELSTEKLIKAARSFYSKKGTPDSFKFLFRVLYGQEIEVYFPKEDILRASDGKWKLPQALRLSIADTLTIVPGSSVNVAIASANTVTNVVNLANTSITANSLIRVGSEKRKVIEANAITETLVVDIPFSSTSNNASNTNIYENSRLFIITPNLYENFDFNLIERRQGYGSISKATCVIESAIKTVDKETGREITEVYISNLRKPLEVNENLIVDYEENGIKKTFSSKIISLISNVVLARNRLGVVQAGSRYRIGDPVIFFGGLNKESPEAVKAVATVQNVTSGALRTVILNDRGYYFREHSNSLIQIRSDSGSGANVIITNIFRDGTNLVAEALANVVYTYQFVNSGASSYLVNGVPNDTLFLYRGLTYTFNINASGHPFWIQTVPGSYDSGNVYSEGVENNGTTSGNIVFTVPTTAPDTLYYVCQFHPSMSGQITTLALPSSGTSNSDVFKFATDSIFYKRQIQLDDPDGYEFDNVTGFINLTTGSGNTTSTVNLNTALYVANTTNDYYKSFVLKIVAGTGSAASPNSAIISRYYGANQIAELATPVGIAPDGTSRIRIYANAQTEIGRVMTYESFVMGKIRFIDLVKKGGGFESEPEFEVDSVYNTDYSEDVGLFRIPSGQFSNYNPANLTIQLNQSNTSYSSSNGFYAGARLFLDTGVNQHYVDVLDYVVNDVSLPTPTAKILFLSRPFEPAVNPVNINTYRLFLDYRANVRGTGKIGVIEILDGGSGYDPSDRIEIIGSGYGAVAVPTIIGGKVVDISLIDRGEGYYEDPICIMVNSSGLTSNGSGALFRVTGLSDGEEIEAEVTALGAIENFNLINRGYDYDVTPAVSLKVADLYSTNVYSAISIVPITEGDQVWQGSVISSADATFKATVDSVNRVSGNTGIIRVFDYSGSINAALPLYVNTASQNLTVSLATQNLAFSYDGIAPLTERQYPLFYGDGLAKANAEFLNGLIKYNGFYLNTDGHVSSDKKIQDGEYYHNFSYELQSEKSINDYKETVERVAHPAGMNMWSKYLIRNTLDETITTSANVHLSNTAQTTNCNAVYTSIFVTGNNSNFANTANVGDLIIINSSDPRPLRQYTKVIVGVSASPDRVQIESPIGGISDGYIRTTANVSTATIYANVYPIHFSLQQGDTIAIPIGPGGSLINKTIFSVSNTSNTIVFNNPNNLANANVQFQYNRDYRRVDYKIIKFNG